MLESVQEAEKETPADNSPAAEKNKDEAVVAIIEKSEAEKPSEGESQMTTVSDGSGIDIKKRKRSNRWGFIITVILFACVVYALWTLSGVLREGDNATFFDLMERVNWIYILIALAAMLFMMACDVCKMHILTRSNGIKLSLLGDMKLGLTGKYYCAITPTSTGGQPMQIYYLYKKGASGATSSSVSLMNYAVQMFASAIVSAIIMGSCVGYLSAVGNIAVEKTLLISGWIGFCINACAPVFMCVIIFKPAFLKWLINLCLILLSKLHILKKIEEKRAKSYKWVDDFAACSKYLIKHPAKFFELFFLSCVEPVCVGVFPYLVLMAFCEGTGSITNSPELFFTVMALATYSTYAVVYIPTPGNSGAVETLLMLAFASISGEVMFWVALCSRFFNYYVYILCGLVMNGGELVINIYKRKKAKTKTVLESDPALNEKEPSDEKDE